MRIATKLKIGVLAPVVMALIAGLAILFSNHAIQTAQENSRKVREIVSSVNNLSGLVYFYMLYHEERPKQQFLAEHQNITQLLTSMDLRDPDQQQLLNRLRYDLESMKGLFVKMASNYEHLKLDKQDRTVREAGERLGGQLLAASNQTVTDGLVLARAVNDRATSTQRRVNQLVFVLIASATILLTFILAGTMKKISISLAKLSRGAEIIGSGNLDHRIGMTEPDEIGEFASSFDHMATQLSLSYSELEEHEKRLQKSEATLLLAIESTGLGTFDFYPETGELTWSDIAKRHFGLSPEAHVDYAVFLSGLHPEDRERVNVLIKTVLQPQSGGKYNTEYRTIGIDDKKVRWLAARGQVFFNENGEPLRFLGATLDITERKQAETELRKAKDELEVRVAERTKELSRAFQELRTETEERINAVEELRRKEHLLIQQSRLAALGEMLVNISHQWRQPLNVLGIILQEMNRNYRRGNFTGEYLAASVTRARQVITNMSQTIDDFRNYFKPDKVKTSFDIKEVVETTISMVRDSLNQLRVDLRIVAEDNISIEGYRNEYAQAVMNVLVNARDVFHERGILNPELDVKIFRENGRSVVTITDNAGGIADDIVDKIFDPYFTTKDPDKGTGIGLFMSKTIIEKSMNGSLTIRNTGEGAEFKIEV